MVHGQFGSVHSDNCVITHRVIAWAILKYSALGVVYRERLAKVERAGWAIAWQNTEELVSPVRAWTLGEC